MRANWRVFAGPVAALLAVTVAVGLLRGHLGSGTDVSTPSTGQPTKQNPTGSRAKPAKKPSVYTVRAGDTINGIAVKTGVRASEIARLNPGVSPTALFIGQEIRLR